MRDPASISEVGICQDRPFSEYSTTSSLYFESYDFLCFAAFSGRFAETIVTLQQMMLAYRSLFLLQARSQGTPMLLSDPACSRYPTAADPGSGAGFRNGVPVGDLGTKSSRIRSVFIKLYVNLRLFDHDVTSI